MNDIPEAVSPKASPTYAELLTRDRLRQAAWGGPTRNERKLVLLRLCDHVDAEGLATVDLQTFSREVHIPVMQLQPALVKLMRRGDVTQVARTAQYYVRTYCVTPRA